MNFNAINQTQPHFKKIKKKELKGGFYTNQFNNRKYYMCNQIGHFTKNYQSGVVYKNKILVIIIKQFNIIIKEYFIKTLKGGSKPWEKVLKILNIKI